MLINNIRKSPTFPIRNTIHAPTRGATLIHFYMHYRIFISIHAPTRGATQNCFTQQSQEQNFNPRSYKRSDHRTDIITTKIGNFNPRSYKRSDNCFHNWHNLFIISIHAPTRGATIKEFQERIDTFISIHAPTRGATEMAEAIDNTPENFNPRSYKRSDSKNAQYSLCISAIIIA